MVGCCLEDPRARPHGIIRDKIQGIPQRVFVESASVFRGSLGGIARTNWRCQRANDLRRLLTKEIIPVVSRPLDT
jgi:hypothetical protein